MNSPDSEGVKKAHGLPFYEFVGLIAALMAVNALGIDLMLPALTQIAHDLNVTVENHQQWVIAIYMAAFGAAQLIYGPLADRFGRRPIMLGAMALYAAMSFLAAFANDFTLLLIARGLQGAAAASTRVLTVSIVRDCYVGRRMARVMSLAFMVFLTVPVFAPSIGQLILLVAPWHWIFHVLGLFSLSVGIWAGIRLPETLDPAQRRAISVRSITQAGWSTITNRYSIGYTLAGSCLYGTMIGFLSSSQQIIAHGFRAPQLFAVSFGAIGLSIAIAALLNSHIVERFGTRKVSHSALIAMIAVGALRLVVLWSGHETLASFVILQGLTMFCFGLCGPNFGAMAMEQMGHIAGTASAFQGFISSMVGSAIGLAIGQSFVDSSLPLTLSVFLCATAALLCILVVERGRLFQAHHAPPPAQA